MLTLDTSCQKSNYQFLSENVIYFSYISGVPVVSTPEIDSRNQTFSGDKFRIDLIPYIVDHRNCKIGKFSIQILLKFSDQSDVSLRIII